MSYKVFSVFRKGLTAVRTHLRSGSYERVLCEAISLTSAMKNNDEWWGDTDVPKEAAGMNSRSRREAVMPKRRGVATRAFSKGPDAEPPGLHLAGWLG